MELADIKETVLKATAVAAAKAGVADIVLESDRDDGGTEFLRVLVELKPGKSPPNEDLEALLEAIEDAVGAIDDRYPSVRFPDAA